MDPASIAGLGLGAASLAIQIFDGVIKGYGYFESAANASEECRSCVVSLQVQEGRLLDWGSITGLTSTDDVARQRFDRTMKAQRPFIVALLSELQSVLGDMRSIYLIQEKVSFDDSKGTSPQGMSLAGQTPKAMDIALPRDETPCSASGDTPSAAFHGSVHTDQVELNQSLQHDQAERRSLTKAKPRKGVGHIITFYKGIKDIAKQPYRLKWATIDKQRFQKHLGRLTVLTDYLHSMLNTDQMQELVQSSHETCLAILQMSQSFNEMQALLTATLLPPPQTSELLILDQGTTLVNSTQSLADGTTEPTKDAEEAFRTTFERVVRFSIAASQEHVMDTTLELSHDERATLKWVEESGPEKNVRTTALYDGRVIWIEWKQYTGHMDDDWNLQPDVRTAKNVQRLAQLLNITNRPEEFRVPHCIRYFNDQERQRFGFLYEAPSKEPGQVPHSLLSCLGKDGVSMNTRVSIAQSMSESLLYLHAVNWLHKGLRSASVTLLANNEILAPAQKAYISGFEFSRPSGMAQTTTGPPEDREWALYSHPSYIGSSRGPFRKSYDMYSLGIVLLEIAHWEPIDQILGFTGRTQDAIEKETDVITNGTSSSNESGVGYVSTPNLDSTTPLLSKDSLQDLRNVRGRILADDGGVLGAVKERMGARYHDVVASCIGGLEAFGLPGGADEYDPVIGALLQQAFIRNVVEPLKSITV